MDVLLKNASDASDEINQRLKLLYAYFFRAEDNLTQWI